jgi:hypothetical protein
MKLSPCRRRAPHQWWWVAPKILGRVIRIPHSGVAVHRVCWFLLRVYSVVCVVWGGDYWGVWVHPPSLAVLVSLPCACNTFTPHLHPGGSTVHIDQRQSTQSARLTLPLPFLLCACTISAFIHSLSSASRSQTTSNPGGVLSCTVLRSLTPADRFQRAQYSPSSNPGSLLVLQGLIEGSLLAVCLVVGGRLGDELELDCSTVRVEDAGAK